MMLSITVICFFFSRTINVKCHTVEYIIKFKFHFISLIFVFQLNFLRNSPAKTFEKKIELPFEQTGMCD